MKLRHTLISIPTEGVWLEGVLAHEPNVSGLVLLPESAVLRPARADDSPLASALHAAGFATLSLNLLTRHEAARDPDASYNVARLTRRVLDAIDWVDHQPALAALPVGLVSGGTACAAAVRAATTPPERIAAIVFLAGRADLAGAVPLRSLKTPTRFIVAADSPEAAICRRAFELIPLLARDWVEPEAMTGERSRPALAAIVQWLQQHLPATKPVATELAAASPPD